MKREGCPRGNARGLLAIALVFASVGIASADLAQCKKPDGSLYVGMMPPENCTPVGSLRAPAAPKRGDSSWQPRDFKPAVAPRPDGTVRDTAEANQGETARRRAITAVAIQNMVVKPSRNGRSFEGTLANRAEFPVYGVRVCIDNGRRCQEAAPATLFPGAQSTFSFEVVGGENPEWTITWDVVPAGEAR